MCLEDRDDGLLDVELSIMSLFMLPVLNHTYTMKTTIHYD